MGCCCSSTRAVLVDRAPAYIRYSGTLEQPVHSSSRAAASVVSTGGRRHANFHTPIPEAFRAPPSPVPNDTGLTFSRNLPTNNDNRGNKACCIRRPDSHSLGGAASDGALEDSDTLKDLKVSESKANVDHASVKVTEDESKKPNETISSTTDEEDVCSTCLEEYDFENPRIITKCKHHFHLSCILEWMERSATCPICDQLMDYDLN